MMALPCPCSPFRRRHTITEMKNLLPILIPEGQRAVPISGRVYTTSERCCLSSPKAGLGGHRDDDCRINLLHRGQSQLVAADEMRDFAG
ncbi:hypothetical protein ACFXAH_16125 [Agrobacterium deltaense]